MNKFIKLILNHKIISIIILVLLIGGGYWEYNNLKSNASVISYTTSKAEKGTITTFVSGSGQVSASNQVDLKSKTSQTVVYIGVKNGQSVKAGALLVQLDTTDLEKSVRDAQYNLDNTNLNIQKIIGDSSLAVPKNKQQAQDNLTQAYQDGFTSVSNAFLDLPLVMTGLQNILTGTDIAKNSQNNLDYYTEYTKLYDQNVSVYRSSVDSSYKKAMDEYNKNFSDYKSINRSSSVNTIEALINETYQTTKDIADAVKSINNLIQFYEDKTTAQGLKPTSVADTHLASLNTYTGKTNSAINNLFSAVNTIKTYKDAIDSTNLDLQSQQISLEQSKNSLADAKANLANAYVYAPFNGIVANVAVNKGDNISSGTTVATMITNQSITNLPFNEIDITKIKVNQKANLTFDAINGLSVVGSVAEISTLGTVTQGVVNYNVKIVFDASGTQVKPGMSVSADIITAVKQDVFTLPNSAIKTQGNSSYVQILVNGAPIQKTVVTGLTNDTSTEIISGLDGTEDVITQTITSKTTTTATSATNSAVRIPGITTGGGAGTGGAGRFGN